MSVAVAVLAVASLSVPPVAAQGSGQRPYGVERAAGGGAPEAANVATARWMLRTLVGTWRYATRFAGNFDGAPDAAGTRVVRPLFDELRVEWTESLDHSRLEAQGIIGFDRGRGRFFSSAEYSEDSRPEFLAGSLDLGEPLVTFRPIGLVADSSSGPRPGWSFALTMLDHDHFTVRALDGGWRTLFTRERPSGEPSR